MVGALKERGGDLADAARDGVDRLDLAGARPTAADEGDAVGFLVAVRDRLRPNRLVEREDRIGRDQRAVEPLDRQLDVMPPAGDGEGVVSATVAETVR